MNALIMADGQVGLEVTRWLIERYQSDVCLLVTTSENEIKNLGDDCGVHTSIFKSSGQILRIASENQLKLDIGFLIWWPKIVKKPLIDLPTNGFINTHPSLLPFCRGKHYNFWTLVEAVPYGVSLHFINEGVDSGNIVAQKEITYTWEDNGKTLYEKALSHTVNLFQESYPNIRNFNINATEQDLSRGSFHLAKELEPASFIDLDKLYKARDLLNLLRARTFPGHPGCYFSDDGEDYEVRISITRKKHE